MTTAGRVIGVLLILAMTGSGVVNFYLEAPLFVASGFMASAAAHSQQIAAGALLGIATQAVWLGIAITAFPAAWPRARALTLWLGALTIAAVAAGLIESIGVLSMVSLSQAATSTSGGEHEQLQAAGVLASAWRNGAHYLGRIEDGVTTLVFYALMYRARLLPRLLCGAGMMAAAGMMAGVAMPLFGHGVIFPLLAPLGLVNLVVALWLIATGFAGKPASEGVARTTEAAGAAQA